MAFGAPLLLQASSAAAAPTPTTITTAAATPSADITSQPSAVTAAQPTSSFTPSPAATFAAAEPSAKPKAAVTPASATPAPAGPQPPRPPAPPPFCTTAPADLRSGRLTSLQAVFPNSLGYSNLSALVANATNGTQQAIRLACNVKLKGKQAVCLEIARPAVSRLLYLLC